MNNPLLLPVVTETLQTYVVAARKLRRRLGSKAPSVVELLQFELHGRNPDDIVSAYLDYLRDLERRRELETVLVPDQRRRSQSTAGWSRRRTNLAIRDPARN